MSCVLVFLRRLNCTLGSVGGSLPVPMTCPLVFQPWAVLRNYQCFWSVLIWYGSGSRIFQAEYRSGFNPDPGFWWPKIGKNYSKKIFFSFSNYNFPIPWPPERTSNLQKKPAALKREYPALQNMKFLTFSTFVGHFCPSGSGPDTDSLTWLNLDPDPDPKHWKLHRQITEKTRHFVRSTAWCDPCPGPSATGCSSAGSTSSPYTRWQPGK
jgi:hypothetical protein